MEFKEIGRYEKNGEFGINYDTDEPLNVDSIINIIKSYENEDTKFFGCNCITYTESGNLMFYDYRDIDSLKHLHKFPNPSISIQAFFVNPVDMSYKFTLAMANNTRGLNYIVDNSQQEYITHQLELDKMEREEEEEAKKSAQKSADEFKK